MVSSNLSENSQSKLMSGSPATHLRLAYISGPGLSLLDKMVIASLVQSFYLVGYAHLVLHHQCTPLESLLMEFLCLRCLEVYFLQYFNGS